MINGDIGLLKVRAKKAAVLFENIMCEDKCKNFMPVGPCALLRCGRCEKGEVFEFLIAAIDIVTEEMFNEWKKVTPVQEANNGEKR